MDKKKLKLVARMAVSGTPPEQKIAKKILKREGISDPKDLLNEDKSSGTNNIPSTRDLKTQIVDELEEVKDELLFDLSVRLRDAYCDLSSIISEFFKK